MPPPNGFFLNGRLTRRSREVAWFVLGTATVITLLCLAITLSDGHTLAAGTGGPILDAWGLILTALSAIGLIAVAIRARSAALSLFGGVFALVAVQDTAAWHGQLGAWVAKTFTLTFATNLVAAPLEAWGEFLAMTAMSVVGGVILIVFIVLHRPQRPAIILARLLTALFLFAAVVDLMTAVWPDLLFGWLEELGELTVLAATLGYVSGLLSLDARWFHA